VEQRSGGRGGRFGSWERVRQQIAASLLAHRWREDLLLLQRFMRSQRSSTHSAPRYLISIFRLFAVEISEKQMSDGCYLSLAENIVTLTYF